MYQAIINNLKEILSLPVTCERRKSLDLAVKYIMEQRSNNRVTHLNFVCTHNSRRSQFSQVWATVAAEYYEVDTQSYSGGVEITECNKRTIASLERFGFQISSYGTTNPKYTVIFSEKGQIDLFSKLVDDLSSPQKEFAAIMTCAHADENCPFIPGADVRIPIRYEDPKISDDSEKEEETYDARSKQIASEMFYIFRQVSQC